MILSIIQARLSSSRLPGKVLKSLQGRPMILHELDRLSKSKADKVVLATSNEESDDELVDVVKQAGWDVYRGDLHDVLDRYYQCAMQYHPKHVIRVTGDCPFMDWQVIDKVIDKHLSAGNDYTSNTIEYTYPDGLEAEIMTFSALERDWQEARLASEREHVTQYIIKHPELFKQGKIRCQQDLQAMRWTVDEPEDFKFTEAVYTRLYPHKHYFLMGDILDLLQREPELLEINQGFIRNEGLLKSLANDKLVK